MSNNKKDLEALDKRMNTGWGFSSPSEKVDVRIIKLDQIDRHPDQARKTFDEVTLKELALSIEEQGVLQPIVVRVVGEHYQLIAGERRYLASQIAGKTTIPAIIRKMTDDEAYEAMAVENFQREGLIPIEEIEFLVKLQDRSKISGRMLAKKIGKRHAWVARRLSVAKHPDLMDKMKSGELSLEQALKQTEERNRSDELSRTETVGTEPETTGETLALSRTETKKPNLTRQWKSISENLNTWEQIIPNSTTEERTKLLRFLEELEVRLAALRLKVEE